MAAGSKQTSGHIDDLIRAFEHRDGLRATDVANELVTEGSTEAVLNAAADHAPANSIAMNVLVETLDAAGIVHRFAGAMLLDRASVDDVAQDSLISIVESINSFSGDSKFTSWVHTIVQRRVVDYLRRQRESTPLNEEESPTTRMSSMIAARTTVRDALAKLPELYRVPVVLRDIEGLPYGEIARRMERSQGTVKSQISRGRAIIADMLKNRDSGTDNER
ncbi:MAG: RNA polymerase sigma factor [Brevibacterium sp.]|uniref:RNA polymerase sigma factor n=1 Tax=Brevibacterium sp. TaxID=1701 RepID=UPI00264812D1|nr:RNA polymerase sigma factor [Brevibacterium sp.]MDN6175794.1 RNA polymerase sigma factor [Brevibacterium sp.]MDN6192364.1 RNA polymerase sigma factor [Brevibacterium sp.]MDN6605127.1 RNA polymerase sigma factor [Brevibacterium sp.]MDN6747305.1 RNA polymerase sigma factor [Brevibacterium sp.]